MLRYPADILLKYSSVKELSGLINERKLEVGTGHILMLPFRKGLSERLLIT